MPRKYEQRWKDLKKEHEDQQFEKLMDTVLAGFAFIGFALVIIGLVWMLT